jgi:SulP family sulfate permease
MGILVGVAVSLLIYLYRTSNPRLRPRVPDPNSAGRKFTDPGPGLPECPQLRLIRLDGSLFFGAVSRFRDALREIEASSRDCKHIAVIMSGVNFVDVAGAEALAIEARRMRNSGGGLFFIRVKESVRELLERGGYAGEIGPENIFHSKTQALRTIYRKLDYDICRRCSRRVFVECARMGKQEPLDDDAAEPRDGAAAIPQSPPQRNG